MLLRGGDLSTVFAVFAFDGAHSDSAAGPLCSGYAVGAAGAAFVYGSSTRTMLDTPRPSRSDLRLCHAHHP